MPSFLQLWSQLSARQPIIENLIKLAAENYDQNHGPKQAAILAKEAENGEFSVLVAESDNRINTVFGHATMEMINSAAGKGEYILTGLEGKK